LIFLKRKKDIVNVYIILFGKNQNKLSWIWDGIVNIMINTMKKIFQELSNKKIVLIQEILLLKNYNKNYNLKLTNNNIMIIKNKKYFFITNKNNVITNI